MMQGRYLNVLSWKLVVSTTGVQFGRGCTIERGYSGCPNTFETDE